MIQKNRHLTIGTVIKRLETYGFSWNKLENSNHIVLFNNKYQSKIVLPSYRTNKQIDSSTVNLIKMNLRGKGVVKEDDLIKIFEA